MLVLTTLKLTVQNIMPSVNQLLGQHVQKLVTSVNGFKNHWEFHRLTENVSIIVTQQTIFLRELKCNVQ
jgi:hypothetical protein